MNRKLIASAAAAAVLGISSALYAGSSPMPVTATEEPPIVQQVNDHEQRIGTLEGRTDDLEARADTTEQAVTQLQGAQETSSPAPTTSEEPTTTAATEPAPAPSPEPEPAPQPEYDPYYIVKVERTPEYLRDGSISGYKCRYYLYARKVAQISHGKTEPCFAADTVLPGPYRQQLNQYTESW